MTSTVKALDSLSVVDRLRTGTTDIFFQLLDSPSLPRSLKLTPMREGGDDGLSF
ncbi:hypothetical cytosolic protein [Coxiella burnetii CbuG_Q212]|nr:hypothetical cytosolic protein [Coxiella burnetii CbuG_Q212]